MYHIKCRCFFRHAYLLSSRDAGRYGVGPRPDSSRAAAGAVGPAAAVAAGAAPPPGRGGSAADACGLVGAAVVPRVDPGPPARSAAGGVHCLSCPSVL